MLEQTILLCEKDLDLDGFEKREACCLLVTLMQAGSSVAYGFC